jgi:CelD/BcsL family acetyltransferase involved in cellulose biosynthesis
VCAVRAGGRLAGIAPLVRRERAGITRLELIGASELFEPSGLLYDSDEMLELVLGVLVHARRPVLLARIPTQSPIVPRLKSVVRGRGVTLLKSVAGSVAVPISSGWSEFLGRASSQHRYDLRRARRRAEQAGEVAVRIVYPRPEQVDALIAEFVRVESTGWKARNGSSLGQRHALRQFFLTYATRAARSGTIQVALLEVNGQAIAVQLSAQFADRLWVLKIGYDEAWSRCSPGFLLLAETMRDAFDRRLKSFEFLGSDEPWMHQWETITKPFSTAAYYPPTLLGWSGLMADTSGRAIGRAAALLTGSKTVV